MTEQARLRFLDRTVVITGGGGAIGAATARRVGAEGGNVVVVDHDKTLAAGVADAITGSGGSAIATTADVSDPVAVRGMIELAIERFGRIDALFNNAAINGTMVPITDYDPEVFARVLDVNVNGVFLGMKYALPHMIAQGGGTVVNTSSVAGIIGHAEHGAYGASKHAVVGLTRITAAEVAKHGVRVNTLCPGPVNAPMMHATERMQTPDDPMRYRAKVTANIPAGRYAEIDEIAAAACYLLSDDSSYVNGTTLVVDGGFTSSI